ncbi:hypothetical protein RJ640_016483 [Escallonia rubra]|uniref:BAG domain-containing protein n=1 Tax=Escallonia rubra TaxID=112253 RepID=A0AA88RAK1_9ASTE|nr:hypothetical protein RJ640_016483 [Escallonia rubra]
MGVKGFPDDNNCLISELKTKDPKVRVRDNDTLMALLFKLDSVQGVDSGMRDLRKGIIKKVIALEVLSRY